MTPSNSRRLLPMEAWPDIDQRLWRAAQAGSYVATLRPAAVALVVEGYGRWISVLTMLGSLDAGTAPDDRVTPDAVRAYTEALRAVGNKRVTIVQRLGQLAAALRIMTPDRSFTWLRPSKLLREHAPPAPGGGRDHQLRGWPVGDRQLWQAGTQAGDILAKPRYAAGLCSETLDTIITGYRRWLVFLRAHGRLDPTATPAARVTRENIIAYVRNLRETNCNASLVARLSELRCAMRVMHPEADFCWITSPGGRALSSIFPILQTPIQVFGSRALYDWGHRIMQDALAEAHPERRRLTYRNGLLVALFAARAPRVRSMASLRLGETVIPSGRRYKLVFEKKDVKNGRCIEYHAPAGLSAAITRYLEVERAELLAGQSHDWFWVDQYGEPLSADDISDMIQRQSKRSLGKAFGPHRFRHAMGTTAPLVDPAHPGVATAILGITERILTKHYNRATQTDVAHRFHASLLQERTRLQSLARREFGVTRW